MLRPRFAQAPPRSTVHSTEWGVRSPVGDIRNVDQKVVFVLQSQVDIGTVLMRSCRFGVPLTYKKKNEPLGYKVSILNIHNRNIYSSNVNFHCHLLLKM